MSRLTDTQLVVLNAACNRNDRSIYPLTLKLNGHAIQKVLKALLAKNLLEELPATREQTGWRETEDGQRMTLRATSAADQILGITDAEATVATTKPAKKQRPSKKPPAPKASRPARADSKQARLIEMLKRAKGATIDEIAAALTWQPHTVRGAIAGALKKKLGLDVTSEKEERRGRVYRVAE